MIFVVFKGTVDAGKALQVQLSWTSKSQFDFLNFCPAFLIAQTSYRSLTSNDIDFGASTPLFKGVEILEEMFLLSQRSSLS